MESLARYGYRRSVLLMLERTAETSRPTEMVCCAFVIVVDVRGEGCDMSSCGMRYASVECVVRDEVVECVLKVFQVLLIGDRFALGEILAWSGESSEGASVICIFSTLPIARSRSSQHVASVISSTCPEHCSRKGQRTLRACIIRNLPDQAIATHAHQQPHSLLNTNEYASPVLCLPSGDYFFETAIVDIVQNLTADARNMLS